MTVGHVPAALNASNASAKKNDGYVDIPQRVTRIYGNRNRMQ